MLVRQIISFFFYSFVLITADIPADIQDSFKALGSQVDIFPDALGKFHLLELCLYIQNIHVLKYRRSL